MAEFGHKIHLLSRYLEGELSGEERAGVNVHLAYCWFCRQELRLLCQTVEVLQQLPREETSTDFLEKLNRRIDQHTQLGEQQGEGKYAVGREKQQDSVFDRARLSTKPTLHLSPLLAQWLRGLRGALSVPLRVQLPLYATAVGLGFAVFLFQVSPELRPATPAGAPSQVQAPRTQRSVPTSQGSGPSSQQRAARTDRTVHAVETAASVETVPSAPSAPLASLEAGVTVVKPITWRVEGRFPATLREQAKALADRFPETLIVQEEATALVLSLPTEDMAPFQRELSKFGQIRINDNQGAPSTKPTILLRLLFIPAISS